MSELKIHHINEVIDMHNLTRGKMGDSFVYYADDADKVIADKDAVIADLIEKNKRLANKDMIMASETIKGVFDALLHHKYKRCLAMAKWCESEVYNIMRTPLCDMDEHEGWQHDDEFWQRWYRRWLELADKFKEAK